MRVSALYELVSTPLFISVINLCLFICLFVQLYTRDMHSREAVRRSVNESLANLRTDYIDLYLVHFPGAEHLDPSDPRNVECRRLVWEELEQLYK